MSTAAVLVPIALSETQFTSEDEMAKTAAEDQDTYYGGELGTISSRSSHPRLLNLHVYTVYPLPL